MLRFYTYLFALAGCFTLYGQNKVALSVYIKDNHALEKRLKLKSSYLSKTEAEKEVSDIISSLRSEGYILAEEDSMVCDSFSCGAYLHTGDKYKWAHLRKGNLDDDIMAGTAFREKMYANALFEPRELGKLMDKILDWCDNHGYPFARIKLDSVNVEGNTIDARLHLTKNKHIKIDSVLIQGNLQVKKKYLYRYLHVKPGDDYNEKQIKQAQQRLKQLAFASVTKPPVVRITDKNTKMVLFLNKKSTNQFDGIIGLQPQPSGKTVLTGNMHIRLVNSVFRSGELFDVNWQRLQYQTQNLTLNLVYPYLFNTPVGPDYSLTIYKRDTTYIDVQNNIGLQYLFNGLNYFKVFYKQRNTNILSTAGLATATVLPDYADINTGAYGANFFYEKYDYKFNPRKGFIINILGSAGSRVIKKNPKLNSELYNNVQLRSTQYQGEVNLACFLPLFKFSTIKLGFQGASLNSPQLFTNELYRIGGFKTIRGVNEQSIYASTYGIGTIEYRFLFEQNSALVVFADGAYYENNSYNTRISDTPYGFGAGVLFQTKAGVFQLNYAIGHQFNNPIDFRTGKINFGIVNTF